MRTVTVVFTIPLLVLSAIAIAGPESDRARRNSALARLALDAAERKLTEAETDGDRLRLEMDRTRDKQRDLDRKRDRLDDLKRDLPGLIRDEERKLPRYEDEIAALEKDVLRLQAPLREAIDVLRDALGLVKDIRGKYVKQFQASQPYQNAVIAAEVAAKNLAATHRGVLDRLRSSPQFKEAHAQYTNAQSRLAILKRDNTAQTSDRAMAAARMIETESIVTRMESEALKTDESLDAANRDAQAKQSALKDVIAQFEMDLPRQPDMSAAILNHEKAQTLADTADAALMQTEKQLASSRTNLATSKQALAQYKDQQLRVDADILLATREEDRLSKELDRLTRLLQDSITDVERARRDVDIADRRYRDALAYERVAARIDAQNEQKQNSK